MPSRSESSTIANEIDAIIANAMREYSELKGIEVFPDVRVDAEVTPPVQQIEESTQEINHVEGEIPANSTSILVSEVTSRFSSAVWFDFIKTQCVLLAGLGGIGSYVAYLLSRLHIRQLWMYDPDTVEQGNMSGQMYPVEQIGQNKAQAMSVLLRQFSEYYDVNARTSRYDEYSAAGPIIICGFDNMEARRIAFNNWHRYVQIAADKTKCLFIDGRLAAEEFQVLCIRGDDEYNIQRYTTEFLFTDDEAEQTLCSYKQTSFMANMIGSVMVNLFVNFCANHCDPLIPRDLPFFTSYVAETMHFKTIN